MLKKHELAQATSCLNRAKPDELVFVLRAKDPCAPQTLRHWATMADGHHEPEKIAEALKTANEMEAWRKQRFDARGQPHPEAAPATVVLPLRDHAPALTNPNTPHTPRDTDLIPLGGHATR